MMRERRRESGCVTEQDRRGLFEIRAVMEGLSKGETIWAQTGRGGWRDLGKVGNSIPDIRNNLCEAPKLKNLTAFL